MATLRTPFFNQPLRHLPQVGGKASEAPYRFGVTIRIDCHPMLAAAHIDPGRFRMDDFQRLPIHSLPDRLILSACRLLAAHSLSFRLPCRIWTRPGSDSKMKTFQRGQIRAESGNEPPNQCQGLDENRSHAHLRAESAIVLSALACRVQLHSDKPVKCQAFLTPKTFPQGPSVALLGA
jgi:hypothetical protein